MAQLYIPKKIKIGFQKRDGTYTGKLAYIIYFDNKGKLRKETSWEGWRHKDIDPVEFDNTPTTGFCLNKDIKRYSDWGSGRTVIRIYDPRDFEFEINTDNLIGILMHTDCLKRGLQGDFVYAWAGTELVLLPTCSDEYQKANNFTALQGQKVSAKDLRPGYSYVTKKEDEVVYLGRYNWYTSWKNYTIKERKPAKMHIFCNLEGGDIVPKSDMNFLAQQTSAAEVTNYAELLEKFNTDPHSQEIKGYELIPITELPKSLFDHYYRPEETLYWCDQYGRAWVISIHQQEDNDNKYNPDTKQYEHIKYGKYWQVNGSEYLWIKDLNSPTIPKVEGYKSDEFRQAFKAQGNYTIKGYSYEKRLAFQDSADILALSLCKLYSVAPDGTKCLVKNKYEL